MYGRFLVRNQVHVSKQLQIRSTGGGTRKKGCFLEVINTSNNTQQWLKNRRKRILGLILAGILLVDTFDTLWSPEGWLAPQKILGLGQQASDRGLTVPVVELEMLPGTLLPLNSNSNTWAEPFLKTEEKRIQPPAAKTDALWRRGFGRITATLCCAEPYRHWKSV